MYARPLVFLVLLSAFPFCIGCAQAPLERIEARLTKKVTNPQDETMVRNYVQQLREHNFDQIERDLDPRLRSDDLRQNLTAMSGLLPAQEPKSVKVIRYSVVHHADSSRTIAITLEYEFPNQWLLAELVRQEDGATSTVTGFHLYPVPESVEKHNRFTLTGKGTGQYGVLLLAFAMLVVGIYAFISCVRTPIGKKKWLWAIICLLGVGRIAVNWTTGALGLTPIWIGIPPSGAVMVPLYSPWIVYTSLPLGAVVFLILRPRLNRTRPQSPNTPENPPAPLEAALTSTTDRSNPSSQ